MRRALELAERGWGRVAPNPLVGALVVQGDEVVGEGFHAEFGAAHAEVMALRAAGDRAKGATLYVNLEPCHHRGKTGPCSRAIVEAGVARVVCAVAEENPAAQGGAEWLRERGVRVDFGPCQEIAAELNAAHLGTFRRQRPFVVLKYALSLDGRLSEAPGRSTRLTSGRAVAEAHRLRAGHGAVMVGIGTVLADDPQLTVRQADPPRVPPLRVVLDSRLRTPADSRLAVTAREVPVRIFAAPDAPADRARDLEEQGVAVTRVPTDPVAGLDLGAVFATLWDSEIRSVLCEGGGRLGSALLRAGLVDRLYVFIAPRLLGEPGVPGFQGDRGRAAARWRTIERLPLGEVTLLVLGPEEPEDGEGHV
jgi:diaminohydroxyphosphoribosylaminopyrimidine deaminase/5-amino-6-(5-phosphoribosylamino)uracil reductase